MKDLKDKDGFEDVGNPEYWRQRLAKAPDDAEHHAVYLCHTGLWQRIEDRHREILKGLIGPEDSVLDAGCGWGRLLGLLPTTWRGRYCGVDISPDFVAKGEARWPGRDFRVRDLRKLDFRDGEFDWCILISIKFMIKRHLGGEVWDAMEKELRRVCRRLLELEYDENDQGQIL